MNDFNAQTEPIGMKVKLEKETPRGRLAQFQFDKWMFEYFRELNDGSTGWGISFMSWLEIAKGWRHLGRREFERVEEIAIRMDDAA